MGRPGLAQLVRGDDWSWSAPAWSRPGSTRNRILLNELVITGAFTYDHDGFDRAPRPPRLGDGFRSTT